MIHYYSLRLCLSHSFLPSLSAFLIATWHSFLILLKIARFFLVQIPFLLLVTVDFTPIISLTTKLLCQYFHFVNLLSSLTLNLLHFVNFRLHLLKNYYQTFAGLQNLNRYYCLIQLNLQYPGLFHFCWSFRKIAQTTQHLSNHLDHLFPFYRIILLI
jgi:hypothetical protein